MSNLENRRKCWRPAMHIMSGGFGALTQWSYKAMSSQLSVLMEPGFFDNMHADLSPGDWIFVSAQDGGAILQVTTPPEPDTLQVITRRLM